MPNLLVGSAVRSIPLDQIERWSDLGVMPWATDADGNERSIDSLYPAVAYLFRSVNLRAAALADVPWAIYGTGDTPLWESDGAAPPPALRPFRNLSRLLYRSEVALCLGSQAYWHLERNGVRITGLRWLDPTIMRPVWTPQGLDRFERQVNGRTVSLPAGDVAYLWYEGGSETEPAPPPGLAALGASRAVYNVGAFVAAYFGRGAVKATVLTAENVVMPEEKSALREWWKRAFSGVRNAFNTEVVNGKITPIVVGEGIEGLSNSELTDEQREDIATALGVPHSLVMSNAANYATSEADRLNFYDTTILPEARLIAEQLNVQLFEPMGLRLQFNAQAMNIYQENETERAAAYATYVNAGMQPSVVVRLLGIQLPDGVEPEDLDPVPQPAQLAQPQVDPDAPDGEEANGGDDAIEERRRFVRWARKRANPDPAAFRSEILSIDERTMLLAGMEAATAQPPFAGRTTPRLPYADGADAERARLERRHEKALHTALLAWGRKITPLNAGVAQMEPERVRERMEASRDIIRDALYVMLFEGAMLGVEVARAQVEAAHGIRATVGGAVWDLANAAVLEWLLGTDDTIGVRVGGYTDELTGLIVAGSWNTIRPLLTEWAENGTPLQVLVDQIDAVALTRGRGRLIATTEITRAYAEGNNRAWRASGVVTGKIWATSEDERVCPICGGLDGRRVDLDQGFEIDIDNPPAHPHCRCWILPALD